MKIHDIPIDLTERARNEYNIPLWFKSFRIYQRWKYYSERTELDTRFTRIEIQKRYYHKDGICYQITEYKVFDFEVIIRSGTICYYITLDLQKLEESRVFALRLLLDQTLKSIADYYDPTSEVLSGLTDLGLIKSGASLPPIISDIANGIEMGDLMDNITDIGKKVEERLKQISRLFALNNKELFCYENVEWHREWRMVTSFSSIDNIIEVECADWILKIPEDETLFIPEHTELIYPLPNLEEDEERDLHQMREDYLSGEKTTGLKFLKKIISRSYLEKNGNNRG